MNNESNNLNLPDQVSRSRREGALAFEREDAEPTGPRVPFVLLGSLTRRPATTSPATTSNSSNKPDEPTPASDRPSPSSPLPGPSSAVEQQPLSPSERIEPTPVSHYWPMSPPSPLPGPSSAVEQWSPSPSERIEPMPMPVSDWLMFQPLPDPFFVKRRPLSPNERDNDTMSVTSSIELEVQQEIQPIQPPGWLELPDDMEYEPPARRARLEELEERPVQHQVRPPSPMPPPLSAEKLRYAYGIFINAWGENEE